MSNNLKKVKGIGSKAAALLNDAGINSLEKLSQASIKELTVIKGIGKTSAEKWIAAAKELMDGRSSKKSVPEKRSTGKRPTQSKTAKKKSKSSTVKKSSPTKTVRKTPVKSATKRSPQSKPKRTSEPDFSDKAQPIASFLVKRISKKAQKILHISYNSMKRESLKNLQKYVQILNPERIKFDPSFPDEKNAILAIDEKLRFIENLILHYKENEADVFIEENVAIPMEQGEFNEYINRLSGYYGPENAAMDIYDDLGRRTKKSYPYSEVAFIRAIEKVIKKKYPDKAKLYQKNK